MFRTPYLNLKALKGLERLKFLRRVQNRLQDDPEAWAREARRTEPAAVHGNLLLTSDPPAPGQAPAGRPPARARAGARNRHARHALFCSSRFQGWQRVFVSTRFTQRHAERNDTDRRIRGEILHGVG